MGNALSYRISGNREENIEKAISYYWFALQVSTQESNPKDWAMSQNNLGGALLDRISGNRRENIDEVIKCYRLAV